MTESLLPSLEAPPAAEPPVEGQAPPVGETPPVTPDEALILGKFKTVDDLSKSYTELEGKLHGKVPKEYNFDALEDDKFKWKKDSDEYKGFIEMAKERRLSQEQAEGIMESYKKAKMAEWRDPSKEIEKLGVDGKEQVAITAQWLQNNLSPESYEAMRGVAGTAEFVKALQELKGKLKQQKTYAGAGTGGKVSGSQAAEKARQFATDNWDKMRDNPVLQREYQQLIQDAHQTL